MHCGLETGEEPSWATAQYSWPEASTTNGTFHRLSSTISVRVCEKNRLVNECNDNTMIDTTRTHYRNISRIEFHGLRNGTRTFVLSLEDRRFESWQCSKPLVWRMALISWRSQWYLLNACFSLLTRKKYDQKALIKHHSSILYLALSQRTVLIWGEK